MDRSNALTLALVAFTALSLVAVGSVGVATADEVDSNETSADIDELRDAGSEVSGADPSTRWIDDGAVYVDYSDPNPLLSSSGEDWQVDQLLASGDTVETNELTIHADRDRDADADSYELEVVYWQPGESEQTVTENGEERTETVATAENVTTETHELGFSDAFDQETIQLSRSDEPREVTMFLRDADSGELVDGAQWRFTHESIATSQAAPISTMGDLLWWSFWWIVAPTLVLLGIVGVSVPRLIRAAGNASPDIDWPLWFIGIGTTSFFTFLLAYSYLADALVALPLAFPLAVALFATALLLETYDDGIGRWSFMAMQTTETTGPTGEDARDAVSGTLTSKRVTTVDGVPAIPSKGLRAFIARIWVGPTVLEGAKDVSGSLPLSGSRSEQLVFLDATEDAPLTHVSETLELQKPDYRDLVTVAFTAISLVSTVAFAQLVWSSWLIGVSLAFPVIVAGCYRPVAGHAEVKPAPSQARSAYATALYLESELEKYETVEDLAEALISERNRSEEIREMLEDLEDSTIIKQSHNREEGSLFSDSLAKSDDTTQAEGSAGD